MFGKNKNRNDRRRRALNTNGTFYDMLNIVLGIAIIICAVILFADKAKYEKLFPIIFLLASLLNLIMGIKYFKRSEVAKYISLFIASIVLIVLCAISFVGLF